MDFRGSDELREMLTGQTTRAGSAPTETVHIMKWANDTLDAGVNIEHHSPSGGEEFRPNAKPRPALRIIRSRPFLAIIDGGKSAH